MKTLVSSLVAAAGCGWVSLLPAEEVPLLGERERVVLVGNAFIERARLYGFLEAAITSAFPASDLTFRNLGWSGDTVEGHARSYFGPPQEGFDRLRRHIDETEPTVIIACYGAVAAFEGETGLEPFIEGYGRLLDMLGEGGARLLILSPPPLENLPAPLPNQDGQNARLAAYVEAIGRLAEARSLPFLDLFTAMGAGSAADRRPAWTENGVHYTPEGYRRIAPLLVSLLGGGSGIPDREIPAAALTTPGGTALRDARLPLAGPAGAAPGGSGGQVVRVTGLAPGSWRLVVDGEHLATADAASWERGLALAQGPAWRQAEELRHTILRKNELFFHRWRPQNETYLFGFRKHEQGNNAREIPMFDPLVAAEEENITALRVPQEHTWQLEPVARP